MPESFLYGDVMSRLKSWLRHRWPLPVYRPDPLLPHHGADGYRNLYPFQQPKLADVLRWEWQRRRMPAVRHRLERIPRRVPELAALNGNRERPSLTWVAHATSFIQLCGKNILIDPVWSQRASPFQWAGPERQSPPPMALQELPAIDLVLITHNHYDHLDFNTVRRLARQAAACPRFVAPLGVGVILRHAGVPASRIHELDWWQCYRLDGVEAELTPAHHWSKRWMFGDENRALWGGFAVRVDGLQFWYPGDTGYQDQLFRLIGERIGLVDLALLPIGAYEPRWFLSPQHVNPEEAVRILLDTGARAAWAVHWGSFILTDEPLDRPQDDLAAALALWNISPEVFKRPAMGETRWF